jgi:hypothetical protein
MSAKKRKQCESNNNPSDQDEKGSHKKQRYYDLGAKWIHAVEEQTAKKIIDVAQTYFDSMKDLVEHDVPPSLVYCTPLTDFAIGTSMCNDFIQCVVQYGWMRGLHVSLVRKTTVDYEFEFRPYDCQAKPVLAIGTIENRIVQEWLDKQLAPYKSESTKRYQDDSM